MNTNEQPTEKPLNLITQIMTWSLTATSRTSTERLWLSFQGFWFFKPLVEALPKLICESVLVSKQRLRGGELQSTETTRRQAPGAASEDRKSAHR
jgi:hypothetical protein